MNYHPGNLNINKQRARAYARRTRAANYKVAVETLDGFTGQVFTCGNCGEKGMGVGRQEAYFQAVRHQRLNHS